MDNGNALIKVSGVYEKADLQTMQSFLLDLALNIHECSKNRIMEIRFEFVDLKNIEATEEVIRKFKPEVVVNCAEGDWNLNVYKACLESGVHVIDLGSDISITRKPPVTRSK